MAAHENESGKVVIDANSIPVLPNTVPYENYIHNVCNIY